MKKMVKMKLELSKWDAKLKIDARAVADTEYSGNLTRIAELSSVDVAQHEGTQWKVVYQVVEDTERYARLLILSLLIGISTLQLVLRTR